MAGSAPVLRQLYLAGPHKLPLLQLEPCDLKRNAPRNHLPRGTLELPQFESGVSSDHLGTGTKKTVIRSWRAFTASIGEPSKFAPHLGPTSPATYHIK